VGDRRGSVVPLMRIVTWGGGKGKRGEVEWGGRGEGGSEEGWGGWWSGGAEGL